MNRWYSGAPLPVAAALCVLTLAGALPRRADAHGLHGHVHVTGWAIENLPPGELHDLFDDPDVVRAALSGAMFPDTGYALGSPAAREYGEYAHWEPFIERFIQHVRATYGPTYDTKAEHMLVAFLLGCASHGLQDELFDSTFLYEVEQRDGPSQEITDPALDGFLVLDGLFRLLPADYFPIDEVLPLFAILNQPIDRALIEGQIRTVRLGYVNDTIGLQIASTFANRNGWRIPWAAEHYLDMGTAGSLGAEIEPTARHMQALWDRLNGRFDEANLVVHTWPDAPRRLRSAKQQDVASWITLVLGKGVEEGSATASLLDSGGVPQPLRLRYTRWGGTSRVIRFQPTADLVPGGHYTAQVAPGAELVDGSQTTVTLEHQFQVECESPDEGLCPPVVVTDDPTIALPVATPTRTATVTATASSTFTALPTSTASPTFTTTPTHMPTATPSPSLTPPPSPTATPTLTATTTRSPTLAATARPTPTLTPTATTARDLGGCQLTTDAPATVPGLGALLLVGFVLARRLSRDRHPRNPPLD